MLTIRIKNSAKNVALTLGSISCKFLFEFYKCKITISTITIIIIIIQKILWPMLLTIEEVKNSRGLYKDLNDSSMELEVFCNNSMLIAWVACIGINALLPNPFDRFESTQLLVNE